MKLQKNVRGAMNLAKYDLNQPMQVLRSSGRIEEYNKAYDQGLFAKCWRIILSTGVNNNKDNMLPGRPMGKK